jgi:YD repeat-containing protein
MRALRDSKASPPSHTMRRYILSPMALANLLLGLCAQASLPPTTALKGSTVLASVNYAYDNASRLDQVTDGAVSAAFGYLQYSPLLQSVQFRHQGTNVMTTTRSYDFLDRLTSIASTTAAFSSSAAYGHNALNKITTLTNAGGDYWVYQYDAKGQVTAASRHWEDGTLVAGQQYEFAFDDIGNATLASKGGTSSGTDLRTSTASFNNLNQFTSRTVPGYAQSLGSAHSNATVTVNLTPTERKGEYSGVKWPSTTPMRRSGLR